MYLHILKISVQNHLYNIVATVKSWEQLKCQSVVTVNMIYPQAME